MKKLLSIVLALSMVLGLCTVGYAEDASVHEDETLGFTENFETGTLNSKVWKTSTKTEIVQKEKDGNAENYAAELKNVWEGETCSASQLNFVSSNLYTAVKERFIIEFSVNFGDMDSKANLPSVYFYDADKKLFGESLALVSYTTNKDGTGKISPAGLSESGLSATKTVNSGEWLDIRTYVDIPTRMYSISVNGELLQAEDGSTTFILFNYASDRNKNINDETAQAFCDAGGYAVPLMQTSQWYSKNMVLWVDDYSIYTDCNGCAQCTPVAPSINIENGAKNVDITKTFDINFAGSYDLASVILNGKKVSDSELTDNGNGSYTYTPASVFAYDTEYTIKAAAINKYGDKAETSATFTTKYAYNMTEEDFERGLNNNKWKFSVKEPAIAEVTDDPKGEKGKVAHITADVTTHQGGQLMNDNLTLGGAQMPGDVVLSYDLMVPVEDRNPSAHSSHSVKNLAPHLYCDTGSQAWVMQMCDNAEDESIFRLKVVDGLNDAGKAAYSDTGVDIKYGEWFHVDLVINPSQSNYTVAINDVPLNKTFNLSSTFAEDKISRVRFQTMGYYGSNFNLYVDNIKIAQRIAIAPDANGNRGCYYGADGSAITALDPENVTYKARLVNNAPTAEKVTMYFALYKDDGTELDEVKVKTYTVNPGEYEDIEESFAGLGEKAYTHTIKTFYTSENMVTPYRKTMIPAPVALDSATK